MPLMKPFDYHFLSMRKTLFVDENGKMSLLSMKRAVFMDGNRLYLLYSYDILRFFHSFRSVVIGLPLEHQRKK